jgi:hypothetical protein
LKKTATILFFFILLISQLGSSLLFQIQQWIIKEEQKESMLKFLPQQLLEKFTEKDKLDWEEENKEFYYAGSLYDVAKITVENNQKIFWAIKDNKETALVLEKMAAVEKLHKPGSDKKQATQFFGWQLLVAPPEFGRITKFISGLAIHYMPWKNVLAPQFKTSCWGPPPQIS